MYIEDILEKNAHGNGLFYYAIVSEDSESAKRMSCLSFIFEEYPEVLGDVNNYLLTPAMLAICLDKLLVLKYFKQHNLKLDFGAFGRRQKHWSLVSEASADCRV